MKKNKLLSRFVITYSILVAILIIFSGVIFNTCMFRYSQSEIGNASLGKLKIISGIHELLTESIEKDALLLAGDESLNALSSVGNIYTGNYNSGDVYAVSKAINALNNMKRNNYRIESIYLYLEGSDYVLSTDKSIYETEEIKKYSWFSDYITAPASHWSFGKIGGSEGKGVFSFIFDLKFITDLRGRLIVNINENTICELINHNDYINEGYVFVTDGTGTIMSHVEKKILGTNIGKVPYFQRIIKGDASTGYFLQKMDGTQNLITYYKSPLYDWIYIGIFSMDKLTENLNSIMLGTSVILIILLMIGAAAVYMISRRQLHPLTQLINDIRKKGDFVSDKDDIKFIYNAFEALMHQVQNRFISDRNEQENLYLRSLLLDDIPVRKDIGLLSELENHVSIVVSLDQYAFFSSTCSCEEKDYMKKIILQVFCNALSVTYKCFGCLLHYDKIALILESPDFIDMDKMKKDLITMQEQLKSTTGYSVSLGIGNCHEGLPRVRRSYQEALSALQYRLVYGYGCIIFFENECKRNNEFYYPEKNVTIMLNQITLMQMEEAGEELKEILNKITAQKITFDNMWLSLNRLFSAFLEYLVMSNIEIQTVLTAQTALGSQLHGKETIEEIYQWFMELMKRTIDYMYLRKASASSQIEQIMEYIHDNLHSDISIEMIADHVELSYSYVRKLFKDETGKNILDYMNGLRIEETKVLLKDTQLTMSEIAQAVGYTSVQGFLRNFRKRVGVTPTEYRHMN